jgi:hypothetical protein
MCSQINSCIRLCGQWPALLWTRRPDNPRHRPAAAAPRSAKAPGNIAKALFGKNLRNGLDLKRFK